MLKNIFQIKTTLFALLCFAFAWFKTELLLTYPLYGVIGLGVIFLFMPDTAISSIKRLINRKSKEL